MRYEALNPNKRELSGNFEVEKWKVEELVKK